METRKMSITCVKRRITGFAVLLALLVTGPGFYARAQETILVIRPEGNDFRIVVKGMAGDLGNDAVIKEKTIDDDSKTSDIDSAVRQCKPAIVVLMDNSAVRLFKKYQRGLTDSAAKVPSIALMGILVGNAIEGLDNAAAISYEIPIVTSALILLFAYRRSSGQGRGGAPGGNEKARRAEQGDLRSGKHCYCQSVCS